MNRGCLHALEQVLNSNDNGYGGVIAWCPECGSISWKGQCRDDRIWETPKQHLKKCAYRTDSGDDCKCPGSEPTKACDSTEDSSTEELKRKAANLLNNDIAKLPKGAGTRDCHQLIELIVEAAVSKMRSPNP